MSLFDRKKRNHTGAILINSPGIAIPSGYVRLTDSPEVGACIDRISSLISSLTIFLMRNGKSGDVRDKGSLARFVDVTPCSNMTRQMWVSWIVSTMLGEGDGNAYCLIVTKDGLLKELVPMPGAFATPVNGGLGYVVEWKGLVFNPDEVCHFRLHADTVYPWLGRGYRVQATHIATSLQTENLVKNNLSSPDYSPPLAVFVNSDSDFSDEKTRENFRRKYLEDSKSGKPWILPADLVKLEQIRPLSLNDLAIKDTVQIDKETAAGIFGMPPFLLGLGSWNQDAYNGFIRGVIVPICRGIEQELTIKLLSSNEMYFKFNSRRMYAYDIETMSKIMLEYGARGYVTGNEARNELDLSPLSGLDILTILENFIPAGMSGLQKKLIQEDEPDE